MNCTEIIIELEAIQDRFKVREADERSKGCLSNYVALMHYVFALDEVIKLFRDVKGFVEVGNMAYANMIIQQNYATASYWVINASKELASFSDFASPEEMMTEMCMYIRMRCKKKYIGQFKDLLYV